MLFAMLPLALWLLRVVAAEQTALVEPERTNRLNDEAIERDKFVIFNEVHGLMRQWASFLTRNGFSVALASIPANTLLYHARTDDHDPPSPEWFAFDPEMSYGIYGSRKNTSVYLRTYRTQVPLGNLLYFTGLSALPASSAFDTQELLLPPAPSNCTPIETLIAEPRRARRLCAWGGERGIAGFVRLGYGFEILWCNMRDERIKLVQNIDVTKWASEMDDYSDVTGPDGEYNECQGLPQPPPGKFDLFGRYAFWEWVRAASYRNDGLGEDRLVLQPGWLVTARGREAGSKTITRAADLSFASIEGWKAEVDRMVEAAVHQRQKNSGIDWRALTDSIVNRYGERLPELRTLLQLANRTSGSESASQIMHAYRLVSTLVLPFYDHDLSTERQVTRCTFSMLPEVENLNEHERKIWTAIVAVHRSICGVVLGIHSELASLRSSRSVQILSALASRVDQLMGQLDWPIWVRCSEVCAWGEVCYVSPWSPEFKRPRPTQPTQNQSEPQCVDSSFKFW